MSEPATAPTPAPRSTVDAPSPAAGAVGSRLCGLHPGWPAAVMGSAILAVAANANPGNLDALAGAAHGVAASFAVIAYVMAAVLLLVTAARWIRCTGAAVADLHHPVLGAMHATVPGALLVLAVMTSTVGPRILPAAAVVPVVAVLATVGSLLALLIGVTFGLVLFTGEVAGPMVNGAWFIPPVVTVIVPMALTPLLPHVGVDVARLLLFVGYACLGLGFVLFLLVLGQLHDRLVLHALPPAQLAPTLWIALGPIGVSVLGPLALARAGAEMLGTAGPVLILVSQVVGTALWGFGVWWLAVALALTVRYLRSGAIPFHVGWWGFVFPLGAYTVATLTLARAWQLPAIEGLGSVLFVALVAVWATVVARTAAAMRTGAVWRR